MIALLFLATLAIAQPTFGCGVGNICFGSRVDGDRLLEEIHTEVSRNLVWWTTAKESFTSPVPVNITFIETTNKGATKITSGGPGSDYADITLTSLYSKGIDAKTGIYGFDVFMK